MREALVAGFLVVSVLCGSAACSNGEVQAVYVDKDRSEETAMKFSPAEWVDETKALDEPYVRGRMIDDLTANVLKKGMARQEVVSLLGAPTETNKFRDHDLVYYVAPEKGVGIDSRWLLIDFDKDSVRSFSVTND